MSDWNDDEVVATAEEVQSQRAGSLVKPPRKAAPDWNDDEIVETSPEFKQRVAVDRMVARANVKQTPEWWQARRNEAVLADADPLAKAPALISEPYRAVASAATGIASTVARPFSKDAADYLAKTKEDMGRVSEAARADDWSPWLSRMYGGAAESLAQSGIAAATGAGAAGIIGSFALTEGNQALYDAEQAGLKGADRIKYAVIQGAIEGGIAAAFNRFAPGLEKFIPQIAGGAMKLSGTQFLKMTAQELPEELLTELGHAITEASYGIDPNATSAEELVPRMVDTVAQTIGTLGLAQGAARLAQNKQRLEQLETLRTTDSRDLKREAAKLGLEGTRSEIRKQTKQRIAELQQFIDSAPPRTGDDQASELQQFIDSAPPRTGDDQAEGADPSAPEAPVTPVDQGQLDYEERQRKRREEEQSRLAAQGQWQTDELGRTIVPESVPTRGELDSLLDSELNDRVEEIVGDSRTGHMAQDKLLEEHARARAEREASTPTVSEPNFTTSSGRKVVVRDRRVATPESAPKASANAAEEADAIRKYPPGTTLQLSGYKHPYTVDSDGNVIGQDGVNYGTVGAVLRQYTPEQIQVISQPEVAQPASAVTPPTEVEAPAAPEPIPLSPRERAIQGKQPLRRDPTLADEAVPAAQVNELRKANKAKGKGSRNQPDAVPPPQAPIQPPEAVPETGKRVWREMSAAELDSMINPNTSAGETFGGMERFWSDNPDLAIGQGSNKGFKVELDTAGLKLQEHSKPGTEIAGVGKEFITKHRAHEFRPGIRSVEIKPGAAVSSDATRVKRLLESEVKAGRWVKRGTESGGTVYSPASEAPTQPQPTSAAETVPEVVPTKETLPEAAQTPPKQAKKGLKPEPAKVGDTVVRYTHKDGTGLLNNQGLDRSKLTDDEEEELVELMDFGLQQPPRSGDTSGTFYFTKEGEQKHKRMLKLLKKASKSGVVRTESVLSSEPTWQSTDGQLSAEKVEAKKRVRKPASTPVPDQGITTYDEVSATERNSGSAEGSGEAGGELEYTPEAATKAWIQSQNDPAFVERRQTLVDHTRRLAKRLDGWKTSESLTVKDRQGRKDSGRVADTLNEMRATGHVQVAWDRTGMPHYAWGNEPLPAWLTQSESDAAMSALPAQPESVKKPKSLRKPKKPPRTPDTLEQAITSLGGLDPKRVKAGGVNIYEDLKQAGVSLNVFKSEGGGYAIHGLDTMAKALESAGYWKVPEGENPSDALLQALKGKAKTFDGMEKEIEAEYAAYQSQLDQEVSNAREQGEEDDLREGLRAGAQDGLDEAEATESEAAEVLGEVDDSFDFGANVKPSVAGEQQGLFEKEAQGSLFNVSRRAPTKAEKGVPQRSELEQIEDELKAGKAESLPGQKSLLDDEEGEGVTANLPKGPNKPKSKLAKAASAAHEEAKAALDDLGKTLKAKGLPSNPMLDPELMVKVGKVVLKYAKANILDLGVVLEQLKDRYGQKHVDSLTPALVSEWNKLQATGEFKGMKPYGEPNADLKGLDDVWKPSQPLKPAATADNRRQPRIPDGDSGETTGTKNAKTDELRAKLGMGNRPPVQRESFEQWEAEASKRIKDDPEYAPKLVAEISASPRSIDNVENAAIGQYIQSLENRRQSGEDVFDELAAAVEASERGGTEAARSLVSRKAERYGDFSLAGLVSKHLGSVKDKPTPEVMKSLAEKADRIKELESTLADKIQKLAKAEVDLAVAEAKARKATSPPPAKRGTKRQMLEEKASAAVANFKEKWAALKQMGAVADSGRDADQLIEVTKAAVEVVKAYSELGVNSFLEFLSRATKDFGKITAGERDAFRSAWGQREKLEPGQRDPATAGELARKMTRWAVDAGIVDVESVVDAVHADLTDMGFEISRTDAMAAMSGYGAYRPLTRSEAGTKAGNIKREIRRQLADRPENQTAEEAKRAARYQKTLERSLAMWEQRRIDAGQGILPQKRKNPPVNKEILDTKIEIEAVQYRALAEIEQVRRAKYNLGQWIGAGLNEVTSTLPRALMAGLEMSVVLRQGPLYTYSHPIMALKNFVRSLGAAFSQRIALASMEDIKSRQNYPEYEPGGVAFTHHEGPMKDWEEMFSSPILRWLEGTEGKLWLPLRTLAKAYAASERGFSNFRNTMAADTYDINKRDTLAIRDFFSKHGLETRPWGEEDIKVGGRSANAFSGRATGLKPGGGFLNWFLWARRFLWANIQREFIIPFQVATPKFIGQWNADPAMRIAHAKLYAQFLVGAATHIAALFWLLTVLADDDDEKPTLEFDPRSTDLLKPKVGETRIDVLGGMQQPVVLLARFLTGESKGPDGKITKIYSDGATSVRRDTSDVLIQWGRGKLGPGPSGILDWFAGQNLLKQPKTKADVITERIQPMTYRELWEAEKELGLKRGTITFLEGFIGAGVNTYGPRTNYRNASEAERLEIVAKDLENMAWNDPPEPAYAKFLTEEQLEKFRERREERKQALVVAATHKPKRAKNDKDDGSKSDETFAEAVEKRDKAAQALLQETGWTYEEAKQLLNDSDLKKKADRHTRLKQIYGVE